MRKTMEKQGNEVRVKYVATNNRAEKVARAERQQQEYFKQRQAHKAQAAAKREAARKAQQKPEQKRSLLQRVAGIFTRGRKK
jgi:hypothetical protein